MNENNSNFLKDLVKYILLDSGMDVSKGSRRHEEVAYRSVFFKLACKYTNLSLEAIGRYLNKDHCTVIHSNKNVFANLKYNWPRVLDLYNKMDSEIMNNNFPTTSNYMYYRMWMDEKIYRESIQKSMKTLEDKYYMECSNRRNIEDNFYKLKKQLQKDGYDIQKYQRNLSTVSQGY